MVGLLPLFRHWCLAAGVLVLTPPHLQADEPTCATCRPVVPASSSSHPPTHEMFSLFNSLNIGLSFFLLLFRPSAVESSSFCLFPRFPIPLSFPFYISLLFFSPLSPQLLSSLTSLPRTPPLPPLLGPLEPLANCPAHSFSGPSKQQPIGLLPDHEIGDHHPWENVLRAAGEGGTPDIFYKSRVVPRKLHLGS